jgi:peptidoglycan LD-endopeptidase LytH
MIQNLLRRLATEAAELLEIPMKGAYPPKIDLSVQNVSETGSKIFERDNLFRFVSDRMALMGSKVLWGGYLEHRLIYASSKVFHQDIHPRNIHLGLDFWAAAGTQVFAPIAGRVHSFQDNAAFRDYGPTVILQHEVEGHVFHSLYGHLSRPSLQSLEPGTTIAQGQRIGWIGAEEENGQWPPHLHFQLIVDMQGKMGDYPGVCALENLRHFTANCPDPRFLLGI